MCPGVIGAKAKPAARARWMESGVWIVWWANLAFIYIHISQKRACSSLQNKRSPNKREERLTLSAPA